MTRWKRVAIIGVGLIGGSIGLALRKRSPDTEVIGIGRRQKSLKLAKQVGAASRVTVDLAAGVKQAELIVVCTPVSQIVPHVLAAAKVCPESALITDAGSTKAQIVNDLATGLERDVRFLGSHPLAGSEKSGPAEASPELFEGRHVVVTPTPQTRDEDYNAIVEFWQLLGANVIEMSPEGHDRALASTSHVPHLLASALAAALPDEYFPLVAGGFLDSTRIAAADAELWRQILLANRRNVLLALSPLEESIRVFRAALEQADTEALTQLLELGKRNRHALGS